MQDHKQQTICGMQISDIIKDSMPYNLTFEGSDIKCYIQLIEHIEVETKARPQGKYTTHRHVDYRVLFQTPRGSCVLEITHTLISANKLFSAYKRHKYSSKVVVPKGASDIGSQVFGGAS
jgi:hypothetical protein